MATAVLLPTGLIGLPADRFLLAVAHCFDVRRADATRNQVFFYRIGPLISQGQVVLDRSTLIAIAFHGEPDVRVLSQEGCIPFHRCLLVGTNFRGIEVENTFCENNSSSLGPEGGAGGGAGTVTVTRVKAVCVPPGPLA